MNKQLRNRGMMEVAEGACALPYKNNTKKKVKQQQPLTSRKVERRFFVGAPAGIVEFVGKISPRGRTIGEREGIQKAHVHPGATISFLLLFCRLFWMGGL